MSFFYLLPLFWIAGIALYASSHHQTFIRDTLINKLHAYTLTGVSCLIAFMLFVFRGLSVPSALFSTFIIMMLIIPAPVFLLAHKPQWVKASIITIMLVACLLQIVSRM
jgi:hypothetical protein